MATRRTFGTSARDQALVVHVGLLRESRHESHVGVGLVARELFEGLGQPGNCLAGRGEAEELDRGPAARGGGHLGVGQRPEDRPGELRDLRRRPVAHLERLDLRVRDPEVVEERIPVELSLFVALVDHPLSDVSGERDATLLAGELQEDAQLDRARVLHLVDEYVRQPDRLGLGVHERSTQHLPGTQEQREVLRIERRLLAIALPVGPHARLTDAPGVRLIELRRAERRYVRRTSPQAPRAT